MYEYCGEIANGRKHGKGSIVWRDGVRYVGEMREDKMEGHGVELYPDGSRYVGQFRNSSRHGLGQFVWPNRRKVFSGQWEEGYQHGVGIEEEEGGKTSFCLYEHSELRERTEEKPVDMDTLQIRLRSEVKMAEALGEDVTQFVSDLKFAALRNQTTFFEPEHVDPSHLSLLDRQKQEITREMNAIKAVLEDVDLQGVPPPPPSPPPPLCPSVLWSLIALVSDSFSSSFVVPQLQAAKMLEFSAFPPSQHSDRRAEDGEGPRGLQRASNGDVYEGEWQDGRYHGHGKLIKRNGIVYEGEFERGKKQGLGVLHWPSNEEAFPR